MGNEYNLSLAECLVGIVKVDISSLAFQDDAGARQIDPIIVDRLIEIFYSRYDSENHILALISLAELDHILQASRLTRGDLSKSLLGGECPKLDTSHQKIHCLHGRHRLRDAIEFLKPDDCWWTVRLYCFESDSEWRSLYPYGTSTNYNEDLYRSVFVQKQTEQFYHQTTFSDGEVYWKIRYYQQRARNDLVQEWIVRLTKCKQLSITQMQKDKDLVKAFDMLLAFPGLWSGLELGNIRKHLALHCNEEILRYLNSHHVERYHTRKYCDPRRC